MNYGAVRLLLNTVMDRGPLVSKVSLSAFSAACGQANK